MNLLPVLGSAINFKIVFKAFLSIVMSKLVFLRIFFLFSFYFIEERGFFLVALNVCTAVSPLRWGLCGGFCSGLAAVRCSLKYFLFFFFFLSTRNCAFFCQSPIRLFCQNLARFTPSVFLPIFD